MKIKFLLLLLVACFVPATVNAQGENTKSAKEMTPSADEKVDIFAADRNRDKGVAALKKKASADRKRYIERTRARIQKGGGRAPILYRLAEAEWEEAEYQYEVKYERYEKRLDLFEENGVGKKPKEPEPDFGKAVEVYQKLLREHPKFRRIDEAYYRLGKVLIKEGKKRQGTQYMRRLSDNFPRSKYKTRANLAIAEFYFDQKNVTIAREFYDRVLSDKSFEQRTYALYKRGFANYNDEKYEDSIRDFKQMIKESGAGKVNLRTKGLAALVTSFAEVEDGWQRAKAYFQSQGDEKFVRSKLQQMAKILMKNGSDADELAVYEHLVSLDAKHPAIAEYAEYITKNYNRRSLFKKEEETINRFVKILDPSRAWYLKNKNDQVARVRANQYRDAQVNRLIDHYYDGAQKLDKKKRFAKAKPLYLTAAKYFEMYIALFPDKTKELYEKEFFLAEIYYFQAKDWDQAAAHYKRVVELNKDGKYSADAAYSRLLARNEKMADAGLVARTQNRRGKRTKIEKASVKYVKRKKGDGNFKPITKKKIQPLQVDFLESCAYFSDNYPKDKRVPEVSFLAAETYIKNGHYSEGVKRLEVLMEFHPKHRFAGFAAAVLFDANYRLRRWDQMERWARYMLDRKNYKVLSKKKLKDVIAVSINEFAQELLEKGKKQKAADQYLRFVNEFPKNDKAPAALFAAAEITEKLDRTEPAVTLYQRLIKKYSKTKQATGAHWRLGFLYQRQTQFEKAAQMFEKMASFPDVPQVKDALYNAAQTRKALGQYVKAINIMNKFIKKYPKDSDASMFVLQIAELYEKQQNWKKAISTYRRFVKKYGKQKPEMLPRIYLNIAKAYQTIGGRDVRRKTSKELINVGKSVVALFKGKDATTKPVVQAGIAKLQKQFASLPAKAKGPVAKQKKILSKRIKNLQSKALHKQLWTDVLGLPFREATVLFSVLPSDVRSSAAEARMLQAEYVYQDFEALRLKFPPMRALKKSLSAKGEKLAESERMFNEVLSLKSFLVSAGAAYRIGESYYKFSDDLFNLPSPKGLSEDQEMDYRDALEETAGPLQEKSITAVESALKLAHENGVYNKWSKKAATLLVKLDPSRFPVLSDEVVNTTYRTPATFSTQPSFDPAKKLNRNPPPPPKPVVPGEGTQSGSGDVPTEVME